MACAGLAASLWFACAGASVNDGGDVTGRTGPKPPPDDGTRGTPVIALGGRLREGGRCETPVVAPQPLRRLSRLEYDNAVRDLFADDSRPGKDFVAEETVAGFASNSKSPVSGLAAEQYLDAAERVAARVAEDAARVTGCADVGARDCVKSWLGRIARRAFRGTLPDDERALLLSDYDDLAGADPRSALELGVAAILTSPRFLYTIEFGTGSSGVVPLTSSELAGRLALTLWRSVPDQALLEAADGGKLTDTFGIEQEARRLLADRKAESALADFALQWLNVAQAPAAKDAMAFPNFTPVLAGAMAEETRRFFLAVAASDEGDLRELLTADYTYANRELGSFYGSGEATSSEFVRSKLPGERRGILTHAAVLANAAHAVQSSPVLRGILVRDRLLCDPVQAPPPGVNTNVEPVAGKTDQEVFEAHANQPACAACHKYLDPIGKGFAGFDAIGAFKPGMDVRGHIEEVAMSELPDDVAGPFDGAAALADKLASSRQVQQCYAVQTFRWALGREEETADGCALDALWTGFERGGLRLHEVLIALVASDAFRNRAAAPGGQSCR